MSKILFAEDAWEEYQYWLTQDRKTMKKINALLKEIQRTPFEGSDNCFSKEESGCWALCA